MSVKASLRWQPGTHWHSEERLAFIRLTRWRTDAAPGQSCAVDLPEPADWHEWPSLGGEDLHLCRRAGLARGRNREAKQPKGVRRFDLPAGTYGPWVKFSITKAASTVAGKVRIRSRVRRGEEGG